MKILCIDDEPLALRLIVSMLSDITEKTDSVISFDNADDALKCAENTAFDIVFADIMLSDANGLDFAQDLRKIQPNCKIVYLTGYPQYAVDSINRRIVDGYLLKPADALQIREILDRYRSQDKKAITVVGKDEKIHIFDKQGKEVEFARKKTMQLFLLLLENEGESKNADELCERLWKHKGDLIYKNRQYLYSLINDMNNTFKAHNIPNVLSRTANGYALSMSLIEIN